MMATFLWVVGYFFHLLALQVAFGQQQAVFVIGLVQVAQVRWPWADSSSRCAAAALPHPQPCGSPRSWLGLGWSPLLLRGRRGQPMLISVEVSPGCCLALSPVWVAWGFRCCSSCGSGVAENSLQLLKAADYLTPRSHRATQTNVVTSPLRGLCQRLINTNGY